MEEKIVYLIDVWDACRNHGKPGHLQAHYATKNPDGAWTFKGGEVRCPIPDGTDFDSWYDIEQKWTTPRE